MKYNQLVIGNTYQTKIGPDWKPVLLIDMREQFNQNKLDKDKEVIVLTEARNKIYRTPGRLKSL